MKVTKPTMLIILDGWGYSDHHEYNAIYAAHPSTFNFLWHHYPHALLKASGTAVGLPEGVNGNSEVGHMTLGAGEIIKQPLTIINEAIKDGSFFSNPTLLTILQKCKNKNGRLHIIGLFSSGYVHSNKEHAHALIKAAAENGISHIFIHVILDGRDVPPRAGQNDLVDLEHLIQSYKHTYPNSHIEIASISGRFYAMDRDENWQRTCAVYEMLTKGKASQGPWQTTLNASYNQDLSDQLVAPKLFNQEGSIREKDTLLFFNLRPERMRQLCSLFLNIPHSPNQSSPYAPQHLSIATMVDYHAPLETRFLFKTEHPQNCFFKILSERGYSLFAIAETEKYAHVTYFFNGGREEPFPRETRVMIPSHKDRSYADYPKMGATEITNAVLESLRYDPHDFYLINYANADMVGHSGNFQKTQEAIRCVDHELERLYITVVEEMGGTLYITSDHGNAEEAWDFVHNTPKTSHTTNPVPFIMVSSDYYQKNGNILPLQGLSDVTPFILNNLFTVSE